MMTVMMLTEMTQIKKVCTEGRMPEIAGALHNASCAALALRRLAVACLCCNL